MSTQSAFRSAQGYIYQVIDYSLYVILKDQDQLERQLFAERLDDIEIKSEFGHEPIQIKRTAAPITNRNENWWNTIGNWSEGIQKGHFQFPRTFFTLVTTANAPDGSIASLLRPSPDKNRNPQEALKKILAIANAPASDWGKHAIKFMALSNEQQKNLVEAIQILDNAPDFEELKQKTKKLLYWSAHDRDIDRLYASLIEWWRSQMINHLEEKAKNPITQQAVRSKIQSLRDEFLPKNLPIHYRDEDPPMTPEVATGQVQFVRQLKAIQAKRSIEDAKRNYIKAMAERHEWSKIEPLIGEEIEKYEKRLRDAWGRNRNALLDDFELDLSVDEADEKQLQKLGMKLYQEIGKLNIAIRPYVSEEYITQGSFHILANYAPPKVGWHPKFEQLFSESSD
ncbi:MAG: hypothetical protein GY797_17280 [Deltaproteobacteria bacterium]|nr:hypothetical protein [Deltaproteobacteria bacterium]